MMEKEILKWAKENGKDINSSDNWEECRKVDKKFKNNSVYILDGNYWGIPVYVLVDKDGNKKISTPEETIQILGLKRI